MVVVPSALLRGCATIGCSELVERGHCPDHARAEESRRGTASSRGYTAYWTKVFKPAVIRQMLAAGVAPVCGGRLPGARPTTDSRCQAEGRLVDRSDGGRALELDHIIPHRGDPTLFRDKLNLQLLCRACHSAKTLREQGRTT